MGDYWNHNTAFHRELVAALPRRGARVLDVGCGDGLLVQRLAAAGASVVGIDADPAAVARARARLAGVPDARVVHGDLLASPALEGDVELLTCVATLHHLPLVPALERMRELLAPGGLLRVVGLAANAGAWDWIVSGALLLPIRIASRAHRQSGYPGMTVADPRESLAEIRRVAARVLPGSRVRRRFYYRYTLDWTKPAA